jgi:hypothetical protein
MRIDSSGKVKFLNGAVGIGGTHTSSGQLDVLGTNTSTDITSVAGAGISLRNTSSTDNNYSFIRFDAASGNVASGISGVTTDQSPTRGELSFATTGSSGYAERMRIKSDGTVHLPSSSTETLLKIDGNSATTKGIRIQSENAGGIIYAANPSIAALRFGVTADDSSITEAMQIQSDGNVHIGVQEASAPTAGSVDRLSIQPYSNTGGPYQIVARTVDGSTDYLDLKYGSNHVASFEGVGGNVGIGTTSPSAKLHVAGQIMSDDSFRLTSNVSTPNGNTMFRPTSNTIAFGTDSVERMRIDSNGRVHVRMYNQYMQNDGTTAAGLIGNASKVNGNTDTDLALYAVGGIEFSTGGSSSPKMTLASTGLVTVKKASNAEVVNQSSGTCDLSTSNNFKVTMSGTITINLTGGTTGQSGVVKIISDGSAISFTSSQIKWAGGTVPTPSSTSGAVDILAYYVDGSDIYGQYLTGMA